MGQSSFSDKIATLGVYTIFRQTDDAASFFTLSEFILPMYCYYCLGWRCFPSQAISFNGMAISLCLELHGDWKTPIPKSPRNGGFSVAVVNYLRVHTKYYIYILYIYIHTYTYTVLILSSSCVQSYIVHLPDCPNPLSPRRLQDLTRPRIHRQDRLMPPAILDPNTSTPSHSIRISLCCFPPLDYLHDPSCLHWFPPFRCASQGQQPGLESIISEGVFDIRSRKL